MLYKNFLLTLTILVIFSTFPAEAKKRSLDLSSVKEGNTIKTPEGIKLKVLKYIDKGKRGFVYKVEDKKGHIFALKIARHEDAETIESIKKESSKMDDIRELGLRYAKIIEAGDNYVLKEFAKGTRADEWYLDWVHDGASSKDKALRKLLELYEHAARQGAYINDLNHKNLFWDGKHWTIIDSASVKHGLKPKEARKRFHEKMVDTFSKDAPCPRLVKILGL